MIKTYKLRLASTESICADIESASDDIKAYMDKINLLLEKVLESFNEIKKLKPELSKLHAQTVKVKEYHPKLHNALHEQHDKMEDLVSSIFLDFGRVFSEITKAAEKVKDIAVDTVSVIYRENKQLDNFAAKIRQLPDSKLASRMLEHIRGIKEDLFSVARGMYEAAKADERGVFNEPPAEKKKRKPLADEIIELGIEVDEIGRMIEHLNVDDIEDIIKNSEKQFLDLKRIELDAILVMKKLEQHIINLKNNFYLLEGDVADKVRKKMIDTESFFDKMRKSITDSAEDLLKNVDISQKIE